VNRGALLALLALPCAAAGAVHRVGPGQALAAIGEVPWESLGPGDVVEIHARPAPYAEKWVVNAAGTALAPVVVRGVRDAAGARPVIDGDGATTRPQLNFWNEERGLVKVGGSNVPADGLPSWIVIEGLHLRNARAPLRFSGRAGDSAWAENAAALYVEKGAHVTIRDCEIEGSGNGLFVSSGASDVRVEGNHLHGNGNAGSAFEHGSYTEARGIVFEANRYGPLAAGALGNALKDRSSGAVIRWNWIEGGNRALDLVDAGDPALLADPAYAVTRVYGNVLLELDDGLNSQVIHFGGDSGNAAAYRPTLWLWHNTLVSRRAGNTTWLRLSSAGQRAEAWNNALHVTAPGDRLALLEGAGSLRLGGNWLTAGWVRTHGSAGPVEDAGGNRAGADPGFADAAAGDHRPAGSSPLLDGSALPADLAAVPLPFQYRPHLGVEPRVAVGAALDIGALELAGSPGPAVPPDPTATSSGCGCGAGGAPVEVLLLGLLAAARRRRS